MTLGPEFKHRELIEKLKSRHDMGGGLKHLPRDGDNDGFVYDGTPQQRRAANRSLSQALDANRKPRSHNQAAEMHLIRLKNAKVWTRVDYLTARGLLEHHQDPEILRRIEAYKRSRRKGRR